VDAGNEVFSPKPADFERAQRIVGAYAHATELAQGAVGAIVVDDEMVDEAGVKLAVAILARGRAAGMEENR
jgi:citrate lyase subunit beta/citryl-CoA lyase